jgi:hypothetical protein
MLWTAKALTAQAETDSSWHPSGLEDSSAKQ